MAQDPYCNNNNNVRLHTILAERKHFNIGKVLCVHKGNKIFALEGKALNTTRYDWL